MKVIGEARDLDEVERTLAIRIRQWLREKDKRECSGVILLGLADDGFSVQYLGSERLDTTALVERVLWIADEMRRQQANR